MCRTCKTFNAIVLPRIYERVVIKAPQEWSRLPSVGHLLFYSTADGLKYTTELFIEIQQDPLRDSQRESEDFRAREQVVSKSTRQCSPSKIFNHLIRILITKLREAQLDTFWYGIPAPIRRRSHCAVTYSVGSWYHCFELEVATVNLLFKRQEASLRGFACNRYCSSCDLSGSVVEGLDYLSIESIDLDRGGCEWAASMLVMNAESLHDLQLGFTNRIAHDYALKRRPQHDEMSALLAKYVDKIRSELGLDPLIHLSLESLSLCGFDFGSVVRKEIGLDIDFNDLTMLRLESCAGLSQAFQLLMGQVDSSELALSALQNLFVRLEEPVQDFSAGLESFLTSIGELTSLHVLIDGASATQDLEPILEVHGESLRTLVWDERRGRRTQLGVSTALLPSKVGNLNVISQYCRSLHVLAIPLDWEAISSSDEHHMAVTESNSHTTYPSADGL